MPISAVGPSATAQLTAPAAAAPPGATAQSSDSASVAKPSTEAPDTDAPKQENPATNPANVLKINPDGTIGPLHLHRHATASATVHA